MLNGLTSLRGILALWVMLFHFQGAFIILIPGFEYLKPVTGMGGLAVPAFFILSGFVLALNYREVLKVTGRWGFTRFWILRLGRIYPVHIAMLLVTFLLLVVFDTSGILERVSGYPYSYTTSQFLKNILLVHMWFPVMKLSWNYPSWSISSEWFAYILFPFLAKYVSPKSTLASYMLFVITILSGSAYYVLAEGSYFFGVLCVVPFFLCGMSIVPMTLNATLTSTRFVNIASMFAFTVIISSCYLLSEMYLKVTIIITVSLLIISMAKAGGSLQGIWSSRLLIQLGEVSYSLYMSHAVAQLLLFTTLPANQFVDHSVAVKLLMALLYLVVITVMCAVCYYLVENPARKWVRARVSLKSEIDETKIQYKDTRLVYPQIE